MPLDIMNQLSLNVSKSYGKCVIDLKEINILIIFNGVEVWFITFLCKFSMMSVIIVDF